LKLQTQRPFYPRTKHNERERDAGIIALHLLALDVYNIDSIDKSSRAPLSSLSLFRAYLSLLTFLPVAAVTVAWRARENKTLGAS